MNPDEVIRRVIGTGEENAVKCKALEEFTGLNGREVKTHIEAMRRSGTVICSSNKGYFYPVRLDELRNFIVKERRHANSIIRTLQSSERMFQTWKEN